MPIFDPKIFDPKIFDCGVRVSQVVVERIPGGWPQYEWAKVEQRRKRWAEDRRIQEAKRQQEAIEAAAERKVQEEREARERKERLSINKARMILAREQWELEELQREREQLQAETLAYKRQKEQMQIPIQVAPVQERLRISVPNRELDDAMMIFMMQI